MSKLRNEDHPFRAFQVNDTIGYCTYNDVASRLERVKTFTLEECRKAQDLDDLQETVKKAIDRRIRQLKRMEVQS